MEFLKQSTLLFSVELIILPKFKCIFDQISWIKAKCLIFIQILTLDPAGKQSDRVGSP